MKILITGADGFIGRSMVTAAFNRGYIVTATSRFPKKLSVSETSLGLGAIDGNTNWLDALAGCEAIIHLAGRAHVIRDSSIDPLLHFRSVNTAGTINLARQAAISGVKRIVFVSSIGVNGAETFNRPYTPNDIAEPHSPYAVSKFEAEEGLKALSAETSIEVVIVRPPLVYGPNPPGNFGSLLRWVEQGVPLPLGLVHNRRSFVALENLTDFLFTCMTHPAAAGQTFLVSDGEDVSTTQLLRRTAQAMGKPARLLPVPAVLLKWGAALLGKRDVAQRLCGSLQVDISKTRQLLGWSPPLTLDQGLKKAVEGLKL